MASGRYDAGGPGLARSGPSVKRAQRLVADGHGEFAAPARLGEAHYRSMLDAGPDGETAVPSERDAFVYDDDLSWEQPLETAPVKKTEPRPPRPRDKNRRMAAGSRPESPVAAAAAKSRIIPAGAHMCAWL